MSMTPALWPYLQYGQAGQQCGMETQGDKLLFSLETAAQKHLLYKKIMFTMLHICVISYLICNLFSPQH